MIFILITILFALVFYYYYQYAQKCLKVVRNIPGPPGRNFFIGNIYVFNTTPDKIFETSRKLAKEFYPVYAIYGLHIAGVNVVNPDDCEQIMSNVKHIKKSFIYNLLHNWLRNGLLTSFGLKWQRRRKILTPTFHFSILQEFLPIFHEETDALVNNLKKKCEQPFIEINQDITQFALKSIAETAMGTKLNLNHSEEKEYKNSVLAMGEFMVYRMTHPWLHSKLIYMLTRSFYKEKSALKTLHSFTNKVICAREEVFKANEIKKKRMAMLDLLLAAKKNGQIGHEGICEEVDTFMFEGHDTTSVALGYALMLLACNKYAQEGIVQEMRDVLGEDVRRKASMNDLQEMRYLERCIKEVLRLYPSVHLISRELGEDYITKSGYFLPKGTTCHIQIYDIHHNERFYPEPEKFDPDRFLPENLQDRPLFAYIPFSAGPRNCIGQRFAMMEMKSAICGILANFVLEPIDTPETIVLQTDLVLRTKDPIKVKFVLRN